MTTTHNFVTKVGLLCMLALACATAQPPRELVDARAAYRDAETGKAAQYKPDLLHEAKTALDQAEASFADDPESDRTRDLAYVAHRRALIAEAEAGAAAAGNQEAAAKDQLTTEQGQALSRTQAQLDAERKARMDAEARAKDAMLKMTAATALAVTKEDRGTVITLPGNVFFASGKSELLPAAQERLKQVSDALKEQGDTAIITIEGHTDSRGSHDSNMALSQQRAEAVRAYLVSQGIGDGQVKAVGVGPDRPAADNKTAEGRASNRRVEIIVKQAEPQ